MLFKEIPGHQDIKEKLIQTVRDSRISHAQLFLGPEGSGKFALALAYAQYINCKAPQPDDSCGVCPSCIKYRQLAHPDLHFMYPVNTTKEIKKKPKSLDFIKAWREFVIESDYFPVLNAWYEKIGIENKQGLIQTEDAREVMRILSFKSYESEYKIMIIWMAEKFHHTVAPRFLKILEEPPDKTLFLLIAEAQDKMISTIISRTQIVKIPRLDDQNLFEILINKTGSTEKEVRDAVAVANGNYVVAHRFLSEVDTNDVNMNLFRDWMRLCYKKEIINIEKFVSEIAGKRREELKSFFLFALRVVRSEMLIHYQNEALVRSSKEEEEFLYKLSPYMNAANIRQFAEAFDKAYYYIERNANPSITFMDLSLRAIRLLKLKPAEKAG